MARQRTVSDPAEGNNLARADEGALAELALTEVDWVEIVTSNPDIYEIAATIPDREPGSPGRPRDAPWCLYLIYEALIWVTGSSRRAAAVMGNHHYWQLIRANVAKHVEPEVAAKLPAQQGITRNQWNYGSKIIQKHREHIRERMRELAAAQAQQQGCLLDTPATKNAFTNPRRSGFVVGDGTVVRSPVRRDPRQRRVLSRKDTGAGWHTEGGEDGETVYGVKFAHISTRTDQPLSRVMLDMAYLPPGKGYGGEAGVATDMIEALSDRVGTGLAGVVYDGAMRGTHRDRIMKRGALIVNKQHADQAPVKVAGKEVRIHAVDEHRRGHDRSREFWVKDGALHLRRLVLGRGDVLTLVPMKTEKLERRRNADGSWRWYINAHLDGFKVRVRVDNSGNPDDPVSNRAEHIRQIPQGTEDHPNATFDRIYGWRSDSESVNNTLKRHLGRTSKRMPAWTPQQQELIMQGFMLAQNSLSRWAHQRRATNASDIAA